MRLARHYGGILHLPTGEKAAALRIGHGTDERWHLRRNGQRFWDLGEMTPIVQVSYDRTTQRLCAEASEQSDRRHRTLYDAIDAGFCIGLVGRALIVCYQISDVRSR